MSTSSANAISIQAAELARLLSLRMQRLAGSGLAGLYSSHFRGRGLEFAELVEYQPGDDAAGIDWLASLRSGRVYRKRYQEEREIPVLLACDCSASLHNQAPTWSALREAAALFAACAACCQDPFALAFYSDRLERRLPVGRGPRQARRMLAELYEFSPNGQMTDLKGFCQSMQNVLHQRSRIFLFSDLCDKGYISALAQLCRRHEVLVCHLVNPPLSALPSRVWLKTQDCESGQRSLLQAAAKRPGLDLPAIQQDILQAGAEYLLLPSNQPVVPAIMQFFRAGVRG
jgi:uncharacterized protein (DUF58 family)